MAVTMSDIAKMVGVTKQTVSLVLNKNKSHVPISVKTREKVIKAAAQLNYQPNYLARNLKSHKSYYIGVSYPEGLLYSENPYLSRLQYGIALALDGTDYGMVFKSQRVDASLAFQLVSRKQMDGIIYVLYGNQIQSFIDEEYPTLKKNNIPFVVIHSTSRIPIPFDNVGYNSYKAGQMATEHLINLGYKKVGHVSFLSDVSVTCKEMEEGYKKAMELHGLPYEGLIYTAKGVLSIYNTMKGVIKDLKENGTLPEAMVCFNDHTSLHTIRALNENGIRVPEDMALVSGNSDITRLQSEQMAMPRTITTVKQRVVDKGLAGGQMLLEKLAEENKGSAEVRKVILEPTLVVRESCGSKKQDT